jgi:hypothetical protein
MEDVQVAVAAAQVARELDGEPRKASREVE